MLEFRELIRKSKLIKKLSLLTLLSQYFVNINNNQSNIFGNKQNMKSHNFFFTMEQRISVDIPFLLVTNLELSDGPPFTSASNFL